MDRSMNSAAGTCTSIIWAARAMSSTHAGAFQFRAGRVAGAGFERAPAGFVGFFDVVIATSFDPRFHCTNGPQYTGLIAEGRSDHRAPSQPLLQKPAAFVLNGASCIGLSGSDLMSVRAYHLRADSQVTAPSFLARLSARTSSLRHVSSSPFQGTARPSSSSPARARPAGGG